MGLEFYGHYTEVCTECWNNCFDMHCFNSACQKYNPARKALPMPGYRIAPVISVYVSNINPLDINRVKKEYYEQLDKK